MNVNLETLHKFASKNGGATYSLNFGLVKQGSPFYAVAEPGREVTSPSINKEVIKKFCINNIDLLQDNSYALGLWKSDGVWFIDVARLMPKNSTPIEKAIAQGVSNRQIAIYDLEEGKEYPCQQAQ